jgi:hypothetical protein
MPPAFVRTNGAQLGTAITNETQVAMPLASSSLHIARDSLENYSLALEGQKRPSTL